jgi:hypothetical protein
MCGIHSKAEMHAQEHTTEAIAVLNQSKTVRLYSNKERTGDGSKGPRRNIK